VPGPLKLVTGNGNRPLAERIAQLVGVPLTPAEVTTFRDGEIAVQIRETVRGCDVFVIQPTCPPVNHNLLELLLLIDALRRASAARIVAVIPYFGYARQDRKDRPRVPISARLVAGLIDYAGANHVIALDLHTDQLPGFFTCPVDHLTAIPVLAEYLRQRQLPDPIVVVAPDAGGVRRAALFASRLGVEMAFIYKRRPAPGAVVATSVVGPVQDALAVIVDDIVDTGGTLIQAAAALRQSGARAVFAACVHGVLSGDAPRRLAESPLAEIILTDSIPPRPTDALAFTRLSVAPLLAEAIRRVHQNRSVSDLLVSPPPPAVLQTASTVPLSS